MKLSLFLVGCMLMTAGCDPRQNAKLQAVKDAEKVVAYYLPLVLQDTNLGSKTFSSSRYRMPQSAEDQFVAKWNRLGKEPFLGLTGQGFRSPSAFESQGDDYLDARRTAVFGQTSFTVSLLIMDPATYKSYLDNGFEVVNDPGQTGVAGIEKLKFLLTTVSMGPTSASAGSATNEPGESQIVVSGRLRVFISHSGLRK